MAPPVPHPLDAQETYDLGLLELSHGKWRRSASLRAFYGSLYRQMHRLAVAGPALEVGSGCGFIRDFIPDVVTSDVRQTRFVDQAVSAYALEAAHGGPWSSIYLLDVLHHLCDPMRFFVSASRVLRPGGRIIIAEPAATPFGRAFYRRFHHEPIDPAGLIAPYIFRPLSESGDYANMAAAWAMFCRDRAEVGRRLGELGMEVMDVRFRDVICYPASGGFSRPALLPAWLMKLGLAVERLLPQTVLAYLGLRMLVVVQMK